MRDLLFYMFLIVGSVFSYFNVGYYFEKVSDISSTVDGAYYMMMLAWCVVIPVLLIILTCCYVYIYYCVRKYKISVKEFERTFLGNEK